MKTKLRKILGWTALNLLPIAYLVGSEVYYARSITPKGISTIHDFFQRFGSPSSIHMVQRTGQSYYEFTGPLRPAWVLAFPSAPPAYVFDQQGRLSDWCSDPGDAPSFRKTWPLESTNQVEIALVKQKFGL